MKKQLGRREFLQRGAVATPLLLAGATSASAQGRAAPKIKPGPTIDVHSHALLPIFRSTVATVTGQPVGSVKMYGVPMPDWSVDLHLASMDHNKIGASVLSLPGVANLAAGQAARTLARTINTEFASIVTANPARFGALAVLPLDDMGAAVEEVAYALDVLKLDGVGIGTGYGGKYLGDASFDPLLEELNRRKATLFIHPGPPPGFKPDGGIDVSILEFMFDTTRMITNLVLSGAKQRYPDIRIISTHGGGTIPYLATRISMIEPLFGAGAGRRTMPASEIFETLATFYFDLTASTGAASLDAIRHLVSPDRLMVGTDFPMLPTATGAAALKMFEGYGDLNDGWKQAIKSENAKLLFPSLAARMKVGGA